MEQLICKVCGEYLALRENDEVIGVEENVVLSVMKDLVVCSHCDSVIFLKEVK